MVNANQALSLKAGATHGTLSPATLDSHTNPALRRLATAIVERDTATDLQNYSRMHHRHARSHTRK